MSRCFPFPPPGYEKKARTDDADLLKKEKHKEKKHKKEKKDKEKREDKDRKDRDKSDGKRRDKKDRKEKSKEKRKDKEKDKEKEKEKEKDKDKTGTSQEKKPPPQVESCNGDPKLNNHREREQVKVQNFTTNENKPGAQYRGLIGEKPVDKSLYNEGVMDKFVYDLCTRIEDEEKGSAGQSMEKIPFNIRTNHDRMVQNEFGIMSAEKEKKKERRFDDIRKMDRKGVGVGDTSNFVGKEKVESKGVNIRPGFQTKSEEASRILETGVETKDKFFMDRRVDDTRKIDGQGVKVSVPISARTLVQNIVAKQKFENKGVNINGTFGSRDGEDSRILENSAETKHKNHKKEGEDKRGSKRSDKDKEKKSHGKDKERDREKKKEKKAKEKSERKIRDRDKVKDSIKNGHSVSQNINLSQVLPDSDKNLVIGQNIKPQLVPNGDRNLIFSQNEKVPPFLSNGDKTPVIRQNLKSPQRVSNGDRNVISGQNAKLPPFPLAGNRTPSVEGESRKRKEANGFMHDTDVLTNKKLRPNSHPSIENGRKFEPFQAPPVLQTPDRKVLLSNNTIKANNTQHKVNGKTEVLPLSVSSKKPASSSSSSSSKTKADKIAKVPKIKPPHPDTKYLSEILSIPKIDEFCECDDEDWPFSNKDRVSSSVGPTKEASETPNVWAEAMQIESADICALPYVIPY